MKENKQESTTNVGSYVAFGVFIVVAVIIWLIGKCYLKAGDEMGYTLLDFYVIMPVTALVCSCYLGRHKTLLRWIAPVVFGAIGLLVPITIFGGFSWSALVFAFIPSVIGLVIGLLYACIKNMGKK